MSVKEAERLFVDGGEDKELRLKYDFIETKEDFVATANTDGYDFSMDELDAALKDSGDSFESYGNPRKRDIWWF